MPPHLNAVLPNRTFKPRIDGVTRARVIPDEGGVTWVVCENAAGEVQEPFTCRSERGVSQVLEGLGQFLPNIEIVRH